MGNGRRTEHRMEAASAKQGKGTAAEGRARLGMRTIVETLGLTAALCAVPGGALGNSLATLGIVGIEQTLACQSVYYIAVAAAAAALRPLGRRLAQLPRVAISLTCLVVLAVCTLASWCARPAAEWPVGQMCLVAVGGFAGACLIFRWLDGFLSISLQHGKVACVVWFISLSAACHACTGLAVVLGGGTAEACLVAALVLFAFAAVCQVAMIPGRAQMPRGLWTEREGTDPRPFRLSVYSFALLLSFGILQGASATICASAGGSLIAGFALPLVICLLVVALARALDRTRQASGRKPDRGLGRVRYGALVRVSLCAVGILAAATPMLSRLSPGAIQPLFICSSFLVSVVMSLFSINVCHEQHLPFGEVLSLSYCVYAVAEALVRLAYVGTDALWGTDVARDVILLAVTVSVLLLIPLLPSRNSDASTFTLARLPENEGFDERAQRMRDTLVTRHGLTAREAEILDLMLLGCTRQEIAAKLSLSSWTVRDYARDIYGKVGVHSSKDLMLLVCTGDTPSAKTEANDEGPRG